MELSILSKLPLSIQKEKRWVLYGKNVKTGSDKCPFIYDRKAGKAFALSTNEKYFTIDNFYNLPTTIKIYNAILTNRLKVYNGEIFGIGYYFYDSNYSCIDIDNAFYDGTNTLRYSFKKLIESCQDKTFIEYSKSKRGLHIFVENDIKLTKHGFKLTDLQLAYDKANINMSNELFTEGKTPGIDYLADKKFVALTGIQYNNTNEISYKTSDYKAFYDMFLRYKRLFDETKKPARKPNVNNGGRSRYINTNNDLISLIKQKINLNDVISLYASSKLLDGNLHYCPLHSNQNNKSFMISRDDNKYVCFSTNCHSKTGDLFDFTMHVNNLSNMKQVIIKLIDDFNIIV